MKHRNVCTVVLLLLCLLMLSGCSEELTEAEIRQANEAFFWMDQNTGGVSEISCFFMSHYDNPKQIDLEAFLRYCPGSVDLTRDDAAEFQKVLRTAGVKNPDAFPTPEDYFVPTHKYMAEDISAILLQYSGITVEDIVNRENVVYLEEYDAFYNFTSDAGPGIFVCIGGEKTGDRIRFWSAEKDNGLRDVLTVEKDGQSYRIKSFLEETP